MKRIGIFLLALLILFSCCGETNAHSGSDIDGKESAPPSVSIPDNNEESEKELLIGTCYSMESISDLIYLYNRQANTKAVLKNYPDRSSLNLAILSGEVDLVMTDDAGLLNNYAVREVLEPLENVVGDLLNKGTLMQNVVDAGKLNGFTYMLPYGFQVIGMVLPKPVVEANGGRFTDMAELLTTLEGLEPQNFYKSNCREYVLNSVLCQGITAWLSMDTLTCHFTDQSFVDLLTLCNRFAKDETEVEANSNALTRPLFIPLYKVSSPEMAAALRMIYEVKGSGDAFTEYGIEGAVFPCPSQKDAGYAINSYVLWGVPISSTMKKKSGEFLNWLFLDEIQRKLTEHTVFLPLRRSALEDYYELCIQNTVENSTYTREEAEALFAEFMPLCENADHYGGASYNAVCSVISEEALSYFHGEITAEKAAAYIQNRVQLYLDEQG